MAAETALVAQDSGLVFASELAVTTSSAPTDSTKAEGPAEAQDEASAMLMARLQDRKIEVLSARTADSATYALPSGGFQTEAFAGPVRVQRDGVWKDIDTSLSDTGDALEPQAAAADITVSNGGDTRLVSVAKGRESFGLGWKDKLPTPSVKDDTASYSLGGGQTLSVTALPQGFSENIKLTQRPDNDTLSYRIPLNLDGLKLSQTGSGHLLLKNSGGALVAEAPAPMMWDASKDEVSGESAHQQRVDTKIETAADGSQTLVLTPDQDFLTTATYPVTVDPTTTLAVTTDTWVQNPDYPDSQVSSPELKSGTYDGGGHTARSYLKFNTSAFNGKHITSAKMSLYSHYSSSCTSTATTQAKRVTSALDTHTVTWGVQPSTTTANMAENTGHWGYNTSCPAAWSNWTLTGMVQDWANGAANNGIQLRSSDEKDLTNWRRFWSANYTTAGYAPKLVVTYNSYPTTASAAISPSFANPYNGTLYVTSLTPTLSAKVTDADGDSVKAQFEVVADPAKPDTTYTHTGTSASVASGATAKLAIPSASAFPAGSHLRFRVRGYDGTDYGPWSAYTRFALNTAPPAAPGISCDPYTAKTWTTKSDSGAVCTFTTTSSDGMGYYWGLDDPSIPKRVYDTVSGTGGKPLTAAIKPGDGWHTLYAKTVDSGGNLSTATTAYTFGVGADGAAILTPGDGDRPARRVALAATGKTTYTGVTYQYRRGETDTWQNVRLADVRKNSDGSAVTSWPLAAPNGAPPALVWNITNSFAEDGPIDVRAAFTDGTTTGYSQPVTVTVDREAGDAPTQEVGPGEVNMLTGDLTLTEADASALGLSVTRSTSSRRATSDVTMEGQAPIFGPDWISGITADVNGSDWSSIRKTSATSVELLDSSGAGVGFTATSTGGWKPEPGSESLTLTGSLTGSFTVKDVSGVTTTLAKVDPAATTWQAATSYGPTSNSTVTVVSEKVLSGSQTLARPKSVIASTSAVPSDACVATPSTKGCRALEFVYATSTTATSSAFGNYSDQVKEIRLWSTEPGASAATSKAVQTYAYDDSGRLRQAWNPQLTPSLKTNYDYDTAGRVTKLTSPGELAWTFTYGKAGNAATAGEGMLLKAYRPGLRQGTADIIEGTVATNMVYDVPLTGTAAPYNMGTAEVETWGQNDVPTDATAVFPADAVPASHDGRTLTATDYQRAQISYVDASGREVNTASPGGHITTTEYDRIGNTVRELTAGNHALALATGGEGLDKLTRLGISNASTAERAQSLSSTYLYSSDGQRELEVLGPLHLVTLTTALKVGTGGTDVPAGDEVAAREHTVTAYDEGRPTNGTAKVSDMPTTVTVGAHVAGYPSDADAEATKTTYDWAKGLQLSTVEDAGGLNVTKTTSYDAQGRVIKTTLPKSTGTDAGATVTTYWSPSGTGTCNGRPEWADLVCSTGPAGAITGGGTNPTQLPTTTFEYDWWGQPATVRETANGVTRTTTMSTDTAGRVTKVAVTGGVGTAVPDSITTYDANTGRVATMSANAQTITTAFDKLGRQISYNDGSGNTTTTEYDLLDRLVKVTDSAPSTTTYAYDTTKDPRGLPTSMTDSVAGAFTATYGADGQLSSETLPGGYTLTAGLNETGDETSAIYTRNTDNAVVLADTVDYSVHGRIVHHAGTAGDTTEQQYTYDKLGRLTRTDDTAADDTCTRRAYIFDNNTNRTALATSTSAPGSACTDTGTTTATNTYDSADRLIATGITYDAFGRTTTQSSGATIGYYANDLVHRQTNGSQRQTWDLDAAGRLASWTTETQGTGGTWSQTGRKTSHYASDSDSPSWIVEDSNGTIARNVQGLTGNMEAVTSASGHAVLQLTNIHGDVGVQLPLDTTKSPTVLRQDEYGNPVSGSTTTRYGWLGEKQRSSETLTGAILMGVRLYDPALGRFLSVDPVYGGNANSYDYSAADPVNKVDLDGKWHTWRTYYYFFGRIIIHKWEFWSWRFSTQTYGYHAGTSVRMKFTRSWTRKIKDYSHYVYGAIAAWSWRAPAVAATILTIGIWIQATATSAYNRGLCLGIFGTAKVVNYVPMWYAYPYRTRC
ncbi:DNRLRE domain-containing protein [Streptomyces sp. CB01373]|uniref:DNRLRE domain-containing protein n=1 Tax=Streptomyces sp. CB01373 TaxID=2020325 RepID=UPI001F444139|nr:DNRLRE domain-containing protein [Streptomyces sp. CB01373]